MIQQLNLRQSDWDIMWAHLESCVPLEGCGLLAGKGDSVSEVLVISNQARSAVRFRMDPAEQVQAFTGIENRGLDLVGIFHSHPAVPTSASMPYNRPSATDIAEASYPVVHVIWSRPNGTWQAEGFWVENGQVSEVRLRIESKQ